MAQGSCVTSTTPLMNGNRFRDLRRVSPQRRSELTDELYQTWREVRQRGLNKTPEYRTLPRTLLRLKARALSHRKFSACNRPFRDGHHSGRSHGPASFAREPHVALEL